MVALAALALAAPAGPGLAKEPNPIAGSLAPQRVTAEVGASVPYRLEVATTVGFKQVAVRLKVPDGMTLVAGAADAQINDFVPGEKRVFEFRLRLDRPGEKKVWAEAEVLGIAPAVIRSLFVALVNPADGDMPPPRIVRDRQGNSYQVQGIPRTPAP